MAFKPKILVVEDDTAMLRLLGEVLGDMGAEPHLLANSAHAAELVEREKFDGIFLDWRMPEVDGLELARRIRRSRSNARVPLVMLTGVSSAAALKESFKAGINFFLQKPVSVDKLRQLMNVSRGLMLAERRRYQRAPACLPIRCSWENEKHTGQTVNLSASGMLLDLDPRPPLGARVTLVFGLPGQPAPLRVEATVVRHASECRVGVEFHHTRDDTREQLLDYVDKVISGLRPPGEDQPPYV